VDVARSEWIKLYTILFCAYAADALRAATVVLNTRDA
jgi:hypothetical protein